MKLWKILLATMIALLLVSAVAMAETCEATGAAHQYGEWSAWETYTYDGLNADEHICYQIRTRICACRDVDTDTQEVTREHDMKNGTVVEATKCGDQNYRINTCSKCGYSEKENVSAPVAHQMNNNKCIDEGDCKTLAKYAKVCEKCGWQDGDAWTGDYGKHDWKKTVTTATCEEYGYDVYDCSICGSSFKENKKACTGGYTWRVTTEATCTTEGVKTNMCDVCGLVKATEKYYANHETVKHAEVAATCGKDGHAAYITCKNCSKMWNGEGNKVITSVTVYPARSDAHEYNEDAWNYEANVPCGTTGTKWQNCIICGTKYTTTFVSNNHVYKTGKEIYETNANGRVLEAPTCTKEGSAMAYCTGCQKQAKQVSIPALSHYMGNWQYNVSHPDCTTDMTAAREYLRGGCNYSEFRVVKEATGHSWVVKGESKDPTCTEPGLANRECELCGIDQYNKQIPATGHNYEWKTTAATPSANGKSEYKCTVCGDVAQTKTIKYTKWYYNNTMTSFGPTTRELVGGNDWYRVTPVDLTVDGVYTYDLIASNKYVVGTVTITVNAGTLSVNYDAKYDVEIKDEALLIYASKADLAAGSAVTAAVGSTINTAETFGEDTKVLVSLILTGNYDAAGKDYIDEDAASALAANID